MRANSKKVSWQLFSARNPSAKAAALAVLVTTVSLLLGTPMPAVRSDSPPQYGTASAFYSGPTAPVGIAVDAAGVVYWANYDTGQLLSMSSGASSPTIILSGLTHPSAVAVDPPGNLFYSEYSGAQTISELPKGSITPVRLATGPFDAFMSVDSNDNLYFVNGDTCDGRTSVISEYVHSTGKVVTVLSDANPGYGGTPSGPYGDVYVAPSGDLYLTACDSGTVQVLKAGTSV